MIYQKLLKRSLSRDFAKRKCQLQQLCSPSIPFRCCFSTLRSLSSQSSKSQSLTFLLCTFPNSRMHDPKARRDLIYWMEIKFRKAHHCHSYLFVRRLADPRVALHWSDIFTYISPPNNLEAHLAVDVSDPVKPCGQLLVLRGPCSHVHTKEMSTC